MAVGEEAEVSDGVEAAGQGVQKEAGDELVRLQPHELGGAALAIIFPGEGDAIVIESFYAAVGDGDAMGVAAEVSEDLLWAAERPLGVDDPADASRGAHRSDEGGRIGQRRKVAEEAEGSSVEGALQSFEEQAAEEHGQRFDRQKKVRTPRDPPRSVGGETAAWHNAMDMRMMRQRLAPGVNAWPQV